MECPRCGEAFDHMPYAACCVHDGRRHGRLHPMDPMYGRATKADIRTFSAQLHEHQPLSAENETGSGT
jgi:hypothetical protein